MTKIQRIIQDPILIPIALDNYCGIRLPDKLYLKLLYRFKLNKKLDLKNPKTFNEKLQWLKLYNRKDIYTTMVDKYKVKKYISKKIGKEYVIPALGIYNSFDEIDFSKLPNRFVIKCTHDSGGLAIVKNKEEMDLKKIKKKINKALKRNYYYTAREWPYKNVKPRILIEKYMEDKKAKELIDYKIYAFNGKAEYVMACFDRYKTSPKFIYYDSNWKIKKEFSKDGMKYGDNIKLAKPKNLEKMFEFASILSKGIPFVRVDFYEVNKKLYFGEMTFFPSAGLDNTRPIECEKYLDNELKLERE